jgi:hypothetical protein
VSVGSNPTRATDRNSSRRPAARTPVLHTGWRRFESCRDDSQPAGLQVFRQHTSLVRRETAFDSRADLGFLRTGGSSNGKTPGLQPGNRGSTPRPVHCRSTGLEAGHHSNRHVGGGLDRRLRGRVFPGRCNRSGEPTYPNYDGPKVANHGRPCERWLPGSLRDEGRLPTADSPSVRAAEGNDAP